MCEVPGASSRRTVSNWQAASQFVAAVAVGTFNSLAFFLFLAPPLLAYLSWRHPYIVLAPAIVYYFQSFDGSERKQGRPRPSFLNDFWVFKLARGYHDFQLHLDPALGPSKMTEDDKYVFGLHPHGVLSEYRILLDGVTRENFPKLRSWRTLAASVLFKFPLWRELSLWSHCVDAGRETAQHALDHGHSLFIVPGGEHEQILGEYGKEILYLKKRMGFVKLALRNGVPLVPTYIFGTTDTYYTSSFLRKARLGLVKSLRIALPLFWGRFGLPIPREVPIRIVFGAPLEFDFAKGSGAGDGKKGATGGLREISDEQLVEAHTAYVNALKRLFDENKSRFGYGDRELCIL